MIRNLCLATLFVTMASPSFAQGRMASFDANGNLNALIAKHAAAHNVPEALVRRVVMRESGGRARVVSKGNYGIMQIRLGTARGLGYTGSAAGLLDPDTNMTYAVKYLAGAYRVAGGNHDRAVRLYASGYYYAAKRKGMSGEIAALKAGSDAQASAREGGGPFGFLADALAAPAKAKKANSRRESVVSASAVASGRLDAQ